VEHLRPDCRLAVFGDIPIRHLIRPSFRHASKERFEAGPHLSKQTDQPKASGLMPPTSSSRRFHGP
jgi:hypothetical protein